MQHYPSIFIFPFICLRRTDFISLTTPCDGMQANLSTGLPDNLFTGNNCATISCSKNLCLDADSGPQIINQSTEFWSRTALTLLVQQSGGEWSFSLSLRRDRGNQQMSHRCDGQCRVYWHDTEAWLIQAQPKHTGEWESTEQRQTEEGLEDHDTPKSLQLCTSDYMPGTVIRLSLWKQTSFSVCTAPLL